MKINKEIKKSKRNKALIINKNEINIMKINNEYIYNIEINQ